MDSNPLLYEQEFKVRSYEVLPNKTIRFSQLINYLQDTAWNHTINMGVSINDLQEKGLSWVLSRKKILIHHFPKHLDTVLVRTWPSGSEKFFFYRDFRILDVSGNTLMEVTSTWLIFDMQSRKMVPVPDFLQHIPANEMLTPLPVSRDKLAIVGKPTYSLSHTIMELDMDINRHTNNANYFQWIMESLNSDQNFGKLKSMDIQFRAESRMGDNLRIMSEKVANYSFIHQIINENSGESLVLARTEWT